MPFRPPFFFFSFHRRHQTLSRRRRRRRTWRRKKNSSFSFPCSSLLSLPVSLAGLSPAPPSLRRHLASAASAAPGAPACPLRSSGDNSSEAAEQQQPLLLLLLASPLFPRSEPSLPCRPREGGAASRPTASRAPSSRPSRPPSTPRGAESRSGTSPPPRASL